jgi:hypothetical protein
MENDTKDEKVIKKIMQDIRPRGKGHFLRAEEIEALESMPPTKGSVMPRRIRK